MSSTHGVSPGSHHAALEHVVHQVNLALRAGRKIDDHQVNDGRSLFKALDHQQHGALSRSEIAHGFKRLDVACEHQLFDELVDTMDENHNGLIELHGFLLALHRAGPKKNTSSSMLSDSTMSPRTPLSSLPSPRQGEQMVGSLQMMNGQMVNSRQLMMNSGQMAYTEQMVNMGGYEMTSAQQGRSLSRGNAAYPQQAAYQTVSAQKPVTQLAEIEDFEETESEEDEKTSCGWWCCCESH